MELGYIQYLYIEMVIEQYYCLFNNLVIVSSAKKNYIVKGSGMKQKWFK